MSIRKFTPDSPANYSRFHTRIIRKLIRDFTPDSPENYSRFHPLTP